MQMSTRSQQLHLTEFCEMNAFSEKVPFSCPELPVFKRGKKGRLKPY